MPFYEIDSACRQAAFLAQVGYESGQLFYTQQLAPINDYEARHDLGNVFKGDGIKFKGRGLLHITGRNNYAQASKAFGVDFLAHPQLLSEPEYAVRTACWWWYKQGLNTLSDQKSDPSFKRITKIISGGYHGYPERYKMWQRIMQILGQ